MNAGKLSLPISAVLVCVGVAAGWGIAWASLNADVNRLKSDMNDVKAAISEMRDTTKIVTQLAVKIDILTAAQEKTSQKVDDIRVMVRN